MAGCADSHHADLHEWGAAVTLQNFATNALVLRLLPPRLAALQPGTMYIAWWIIQADSKTPVLPVALEASVKALRSTCSATPGSRNQSYTRRSSAPSRQSSTPARSSSSKPCSMTSALSGEVRFCDVAVGALQHLSKQDFGVTKWNAPLAERDAALAKAIEWSRKR